MRVKLKQCILCFVALVIILKASEMIFSSREEYDEMVDFEFPREDRLWLKNLKASRSEEIPTVIVEEHFEVLQYWFQAAELDFIPKSKNVLIHIDGHVDGAIPTDVSAIPWFRPPRDPSEVLEMMQRNDMFIVAAVLTGLIDHVIWVWPTWDETDHNGQDWTYLKYDVEIGTSKDGQDIGMSQLCFCWTYTEPETSIHKYENEERWQCHVKSNDCEEGVECPKISRSKCVIQSRVLFEVVSESVASVVLAEEKWPSEKGLILDIDEDYFGCWSDVIPLYEAGIAQKNLDVLTDVVSALFCASTAEDEALADRVYAAVVAFVKSLKSLGCVLENAAYQNFGDVGCLDSIDMQNFLVENSEDIATFTKLKQSVRVFCSAEENSKGSEDKMEGLMFHSLFRYLLNFSLEQLDLLQELGICFDVSPSSPSFPSDGKFRVCHGDNVPNKTLVYFHLPTKKEIGNRAVLLNEIVSSVVKKPNIVTICRSVRDGYTPKSFSHLIESKLMENIAESYRGINVSGVYYDSNLLGGKKGWNGRSQTLVPYFTQFFKVISKSLPLFSL